MYLGDLLWQVRQRRPALFLNTELSYSVLSKFGIQQLTNKKRQAQNAPASESNSDLEGKSHTELTRK
jgi:hypothetical protein